MKRVLTAGLAVMAASLLAPNLAQAKFKVVVGAPAAPMAVPAVEIATMPYYRHSPSPLANRLMRDGNVQKSLQVTSDEMRQITDIVATPSYNGVGPNGVIDEKMIREMKMRQASQQPAQIEAKIKDVLGKERFARLEQIELQLSIPTRQQLFYRLRYRNQNTPSMFGPEDTKAVQDAYNKYRAKQQAMYRKIRGMDPKKANELRQQMTKEYQKMMEQSISDKMWKKFQIACGEKYTAGQHQGGGVIFGGGVRVLPAVMPVPGIKIAPGAPAKKLGDVKEQLKKLRAEREAAKKEAAKKEAGK